MENISITDKLKKLITLGDKLVKVQQDTVVNLLRQNQRASVSNAKLAYVENLYHHYVISNGDKTYNTQH